MRRLLPWGAFAALAVYYGYFAALSLRADLTHDDLMNLHRAVVTPWPGLVKECVFFFLPSPNYRPIGALFYRISFELFGPQAFPLHVALGAAWAVGLVCVFDWLRQLSRSAEIALLATLFTTHHSNRPFLYTNAGFCYDILCHLFYFAALAYYLRARDRGRLRERDLLVLTALFVLALGSKEMAVSLPVVIAATEWWRYRGQRDGRFVLLSAAMAALFVGGRVFGPQGISGAGGYAVVPNLRLYFESWSGWLAQLTYSAPEQWPLAGIVLLLTGIAFTAWLTGDAAPRIAAIFLLTGVLPLAFIRPLRGLEAACIPLTALAALSAWWLARLTWIIPWRSRAALLFTLLLILLWDLHARRAPPEEAMLREGRDIRRIWTAWRKTSPPLRAPARVLITQDPFPPPYTWATTFLAQIDHGPGLWIVSEYNEAQPPPHAEFDYVIAWRDDRFVFVKRP